MGKSSLARHYYDPENPGSFGGVEKLRRVTKHSKTFVKKFLEGEDAYTLHKDIRRKFNRRKVIVGGINQQFQIDLLDVRNIKLQNDNVSYLLTGIDCFSKKGYAIPLKNKTGESILQGLKVLFPSKDKSPLFIQSDDGAEFKNKQVQEYFKNRGITFFTSKNRDIKASIIERFNRTLRGRIYRYLTKNNTKRYIDVLNKIITGYNKSFHRSIKFAPADVNTENQERIWDTLYNSTVKNTPDVIKSGDRVRISKVKTVFSKGYLPSWTSELFTVSEVLETQPRTYKLKDDHGFELEGIFYYYEIEKVADKEFYLISNILKERKRGGKKEFLISWYGYDESFNSWIPAMNIKHYE